MQVSEAQQQILHLLVLLDAARPGTFVSDRAIANELNLSISLVHDALGSLEQENYVNRTWFFLDQRASIFASLTPYGRTSVGEPGNEHQECIETLVATVESTRRALTTARWNKERLERQVAAAGGQFVPHQLHHAWEATRHEVAALELCLRELEA